MKSSGWQSRNHILDLLPRPALTKDKELRPEDLPHHIQQNVTLEPVLPHSDLRAQLPAEDKPHSQLQLRQAGTVPPCQSSHGQGRASLGPHWFPAGTCAHLVPVSLLYHRQRELWGTESVSSCPVFTRYKYSTGEHAAGSSCHSR